MIWTSAGVVDLHFAPLMQVLSTLLVSKTRTSHVCLAATFSFSLRVASQVGTSFSQNHSEQGEHPANCLLIENHHSHNENSSFFSLNKSFCGLISSFLLIGGTIFYTECQHLKHIENFHSFWQMLHCRHTTAPTHVCFGALSIDWTNFTAINCKSRKNISWILVEIPLLKLSYSWREPRSWSPGELLSIESCLLKDSSAHSLIFNFQFFNSRKSQYALPFPYHPISITLSYKTEV